MGRHSSLRDTLAKWIDELGYQPKREQAMPRWNTETERAIMDIVYIDNIGREISVDTAVIDGAEGGSRAPAKFALQRMEKRNTVDMLVLASTPLLLIVEANGDGRP